MNTYAINFTDFTGHFWNLDWKPTTSKNKNLKDTDVQSVVHYIRTGNWPVVTSVAAKNCYDMLAAQIANVIIDDCITGGSNRLNEVVLRIERAYAENRLSPKGDELYERCGKVAAELSSEENRLVLRKLLTKILKNENLFAVKMAVDEAWRVKVVEEDMKCCICGAVISDEQSHDPYPVRPESWYGEKENRCCANCNYQIVIPARLRFGRSEASYRKLAKLDRDDLIGIFG